jgi:hypothetical protein
MTISQIVVEITCAFARQTGTILCNGFENQLSDEEQKKVVPITFSRLMPYGLWEVEAHLRILEFEYVIQEAKHEVMYCLA